LTYRAAARILCAVANSIDIASSVSLQDSAITTGAPDEREIREIVEDENKISTVIADDIEFRGRLVFKNSLKIKGFFEGKIETKGHLMIGQRPG
jgi:hypothetical protein